MGAPQVPTRWAVGQAVLNHEPHRQSDHAVGILTARGRQSGEVGAKGLATLRTVRLGIGHQQLPRTPYVEIPQIMERPMRLLVPIGRVTTTRTRVPYVVTTVRDDLGLGQVCGCGDPGAGVGSVLTWTEHRIALLAQRFGPALYAKRLLGATRCTRYSIHFSGSDGGQVADPLIEARGAAQRPHGPCHNQPLPGLISNPFRRAISPGRVLCPIPPADAQTHSARPHNTHIRVLPGPGDP